MERSAINSFTTAGATFGLAFGLYVADRLIGTDDPGFFLSLAGLLAMPFAAAANVLVSRSFRRASRRKQMFLAVSGWVVFFASVAVLFLAIAAMFPQAVAPRPLPPAQAPLSGAAMRYSCQVKQLAVGRLDTSSNRCVGTSPRRLPARRFAPTNDRWRQA